MATDHASRAHVAPLPRAMTARHQRGAVLYVALIMLILIALIGLVGMQISGMQERMSSNYRSANLGFQNAEQRAREAECFIESSVNRAGSSCATVQVDSICDDEFDPQAWAQSLLPTTPIDERIRVRAIGPCMSGNTSLAAGRPVDESPNPVFQITSYATDPDSPSNIGAGTAIDTIFRP